MKSNIIKKIVALSIFSISLFGFNSIEAKAEWKQNLNGQWNYILDDGSLLKNKWLYDKKTNVWCHLNENGVRTTGWFKDNEKWYYLYNNGAMAHDTTTPDGYKVDSIGAWIGNTPIISNINNQNINNGWQTINGQKYYIKPDGTKLTGWLKDSEGKWYYLKADGVMLSNNWINDNGKWYYLDFSGVRVSNTVIDGYKIGADGVRIENNSNNNEDTSYTVNGKYSASNPSVKTLSDLEDYLNENYSKLKTPLGTINFSFKTLENDNKMFPYDFWIQTDWGDIDNPKYEDYSYFEPYDLKNSIKITDSDKEKTKELLKEYQEKIAEVSMKYFPNKKIQGGFYSGFYKYQYIKVGYESIEFYSWENYELDKSDRYYYKDEYGNSELTNFHWNTENDDYFN